MVTVLYTNIQGVPISISLLATIQKLLTAIYTTSAQYVTSTNAQPDFIDIVTVR